MQAKVEICGVNTAELPVYSASQTEAMLRRSASGDRGAREELIRGNLRLVLSVVQRFRDRGESPDDLFQVGCIGLMKSIDHFNTELGVRFSTYAVPMNVIWGNPPKKYNMDCQTREKGENICYSATLTCWTKTLRHRKISMSA